MLTLPGRLARASATASLLAAAIAALPSLDWCPLTEWTGPACAAHVASAAPRHDPAPACGGDDACPLAASREASPAACASPAWPLCDPEPDPLPMGDRLWCVRPPVIAIGAKAVPLDAPAPSEAFAMFVAPPVLAPPAVVALVRAVPPSWPALLRGAHSPPQPRAPPCS